MIELICIQYLTPCHGIPSEGVKKLTFEVFYGLQTLEIIRSNLTKSDFFTPSQFRMEKVYFRRVRVLCPPQIRAGMKPAPTEVPPVTELAILYITLN